MSASNAKALEFLELQPLAVHKRMYQQPSTVLAVLRRMLPHLAKQIVMMMLYHPGHFPVADLEAYIRSDARGEKEKSVGVLERLHIISVVQDHPGARSYRLSPDLAKSLKHALTGGGDHKSFGIPCSTPDKHKVDIPFLDAYARKQWEAILYYMVGSTGSGVAGAPMDDISQGTKTLLQMGNFVVVKGARSATITQEGFTFLLEDINSQVWSLLIVYLSNCEYLHFDLVDCMSFLFMLGSMELGQSYSTVSLSPTQVRMLEDLGDFGIVYRRDGASDRFYPTRLATTLTSDAISLQSSSGASFNAMDSGSAAGKGYIIVETNYRIYAYTNSVLQIAVLNLFAKLSMRFPNLVAGKLTRESIQRAISYGITANQICSYLTVHAHPQMKRGFPVLPPTVADQVRLWQIEGDRMEATPGFLVKNFDTFAQYKETVDYATSLGVMKWKSDERRLVFVDNINLVKGFLNSLQKRSAPPPQTQR